MIVTALLTSVGINFGLCILFYTLYSILRKQPGNAHVYNARLVAEKKVKEGGQFQLDRLLPSAGWVKKAWQPSEEELLSIAGFDSVVFIRVFIFWYKCILSYKFLILERSRVTYMEIWEIEYFLHLNKEWKLRLIRSNQLGKSLFNLVV